MKVIDLEISRDLGLSGNTGLRQKGSLRKASARPMAGMDSKLARNVRLEMMARESDDFFDLVQC